VELSYSVEKLVFLKLKLERFFLEIHSLDIAISDSKGGYNEE
jgi:hypothetical protein